jgi:hypothetical protein
MLKAKITFFDIEKCGFYEKRNKIPIGGNITDTLDKLNSWVINSSNSLVANTKTHEEDKDSSIKNTYFCKWIKNNNQTDSLLVLWNEMQNENGSIYRIKTTTSLGNFSFTKATEQNDTIPGLPSYFWFMPDTNQFAAIVFKHSIQGKGPLEKYLKGFLQNKHPSRVNDGEENIIGYNFGNDPSIYFPKFSAKICKNKSAEQAIRNNVNEIRHLIKKETFLYSTNESNNLITRIFKNWINIPAVSDDQDKRKLIHQINFKPTLEELNNIINNFNGTQDSANLNKIGFKLKNGQCIMLENIADSFDYDFDLKISKSNFIEPTELFNTIIENKQYILNKLTIKENEELNICSEFL